jgi:hypothetical protein
MRALVATLFWVWGVLALSVAGAQAPGPSARAIQIFGDVCISTNAARLDVLARLDDDGWSPSTYGSLPTTDNSRRAADVVNLIGSEPEDTLVFTKVVAGKPVFVHLFARAREERGRIVRAPACNVMIVGVTRREFANALLSDPAARSAFMTMPLVRQTLNERAFVALSSDIDPRHPTAAFGTLAMLSFEGPEEDEA